MNKAEELIACLEGEIAKRDAVIVGLTNSRDFWREKAIAADDELAALKAQEPVLPCELDLESSFSCAEKEASLHAGVRDTFYFALIECLQKNKLYRAPAQKELSVVMPERKKAHNCEGIEFWKANGWNDCLDELASIYAAPVSEAKAQGEYGDAYQGAREDLTIWKRRALEAEKALQEERIITERLGNALNEENGPTFMGEPVFPAKAQGVVQWPDADEIMQMAFEEGQPADDASGYCFELEEFDLFIDRLMSEVARLNTAPVQQVSVPDERAAFEVQFPLEDGVEWNEADQRYEAFTAFDRSRQHAVDWQNSMLEVWQSRAMLASAPAAPAADAGLVEALKQAFPLFDEDGLNELYLHCEIAVLGDRKRLHKLLATHSAKGVV